MLVYLVGTRLFKTEGRFNERLARMLEGAGFLVSCRSVTG